MQLETSRRGLKRGHRRGGRHQRIHHAAQQICAVYQLGVLQKVSILQKGFQVMGVLTLKHSCALFGSMALGLMP